MTRLLLPLLLLAASMPALAGTAIARLEFDGIRKQQGEIRADVVARTGRYEGMSRGTRTELLDRQNEVLAIIEGKHAPDELSEDQRTRLFNHLEWIEAAINKTEDERLICQYTTATGSNRKQRVCRTQAQIEQERERARQTLDRTDRNMRRAN